MKTVSLTCMLIGGCLASAIAAPKVAVLDFENEATASKNGVLAGGVTAADLTNKGAYVLSREVLKGSEYQVIDRRDFTSKLPKSSGEGDVQVSWIHAAQLLNADAALRGVILSFSTSSENLKQGGHSAQFNKMSMTIMVQALDAVNGTVIAMAEGSAEKSVRQTSTKQLQLGENDLLSMLTESVQAAMPELKENLDKRLETLAERKKARITIKATEDPALVEIDGVLVGSTPIEYLDVYEGDHVIRISRPGYTSFTKRLAVSGDLEITAPMLRTDITAEERVKIMSAAEMKIFMQNQKPDLLIQEIK